LSLAQSKAKLAVETESFLEPNLLLCDLAILFISERRKLPYWLDNHMPLSELAGALQLVD
jgi:hypothetical protein